MDEEAVRSSSKEDLEDLGLKERGHIICLKSFVITSNAENKRFLAQTIKGTSFERQVKRKKVTRLQVKQVSIGWKHCEHASETFTQIRAQSGGGVRDLKVTNATTLADLKKEAIELFFPQSNSRKFGSIHQMNVSLGDFSGEPISNLETTIADHINSTKLTGRTRLYLLTKKKGPNELFKNLIENVSDDEDDFDPFSFKSSGF